MVRICAAARLSVQTLIKAGEVFLSPEERANKASLIPQTSRSVELGEELSLVPKLIKCLGNGTEPDKTIGAEANSVDVFTITKPDVVWDVSTNTESDLLGVMILSEGKK